VLKRATRRYAKRQMTWFSAKDYVRWVDMTEDGRMRSVDALLGEILAD
jgi:tRNA A37 N6-isopentenylltransferase MiaA